MRDEGRVEVVDYLRGIAAAAVAWFHLTNQYGGWVTSSGSYGWLGVEMFFVISGFVIPYTLARWTPAFTLRSFPAFMARRSIRLEPPYIASILVVLVLNGVAAQVPGFRGEAPVFDGFQILSNVLYVVPITHYAWLQPVYWTLAYELVFYIVIGLSFPWVGAEARPWSSRLIAMAVLAMIVAMPDVHLAALFVMGLMAHRRVSFRESPFWCFSLMVAAALCMAALGHVFEAAVGLLTAFMISFHRHMPRLPGRLVCFLSWLGLISYSLYLVHVPVGGKIVNLGRRFIEGSMSELALSMIAFLVSAGVATLFWRLIELPAQRASRGFSCRGAPASRMQGEDR